MTAEQIDKLEPGRELDALIAEKVMGWKWYVGVANLGSGPKYRYLDEPNEWNPLRPEWDGVTEMPIGHPAAQDSRFPYYSDDISAAWLVVEKLTTTTKQWFHYEQSSTTCTAIFQNDAYEGWDACSEADTVPLAICRAALKAVSAQQEHPAAYAEGELKLDGFVPVMPYPWHDEPHQNCWCLQPEEEPN